MYDESYMGTLVLKYQHRYCRIVSLPLCLVGISPLFLHFLNPSIHSSYFPFYPFQSNVNSSSQWGYSSTKETKHNLKDMCVTMQLKDIKSTIYIFGKKVIHYYCSFRFLLLCSIIISACFILAMCFVA